ncbi:MAG TPA: triose-phosphate isomerase [Nautiliaceae bacterium]|nr:triose-phosphate isomerase [Nautiliaceae bacterium]
MIIVNFKSYSLNYFFKVLKAIEEINQNYGKIVYFAVPSTFFYLKKDFFIAQDFFPEEGAYTGEITYKNLRYFDIKGSLLNHSEKQKKFNELIKCLFLVDNDFLLTVCADSKESAISLHYINEKLKKISYIAYEPPELIGSNISVSKAKPEIIKDLTKEIDYLLVGAGIKTKEDVKKSLELGAKGVLIASGVVKSDNPKNLLEEFVSLF